VRISRVAVAQGNLTLRVEEAARWSCSPTLQPRAKPWSCPARSAEIERPPGTGLAEVSGGTSLSEVVAGLNALGVAPRDMIDILKSINAAGALHADAGGPILTQLDQNLAGNPKPFQARILRNILQPKGLTVELRDAVDVVNDKRDMIDLDRGRGGGHGMGLLQRFMQPTWRQNPARTIGACEQSVSWNPQPIGKPPRMRPRAAGARLTAQGAGRKPKPTYKSEQDRWPFIFTKATSPTG
jgi:hypothetical protein